MKENMRGLFYIVRGRNVNKKEPRVYNKARDDYDYIGGYRPTDADNDEWYQVKDNITFTTHSTTTTLDRAILAIKTLIRRYKDKDRFIREVRKHYTTPQAQVNTCKEVYDRWGDYYEDEVKSAENLAYQELREERPLNKARLRAKRIKENISDDSGVEVVFRTPVIEAPMENSIKKSGVIRPKKRLVRKE